jgi:Na+/pantothenate symporter
LEFLPTNNLTIFEYKGSQFVELLKPFEFEKGNVKYSIIAAVLSNINSNKKDQIIKIFQDLIQTKREKDRTITDLSKENLILISLRLVEAQNFKRLIIIAIIG